MSSSPKEIDRDGKKILIPYGGARNFFSFKSFSLEKSEMNVSPLELV
jgi:hypothetical protein